MAAEQRWALVTGASSGIGAALARVFAARGYSLVLVARRQERLAALAEELSRPNRVAVEALAMNLENPTTPEALCDALERRAITLHTLVNNAGFGLRGQFATLPYDRQIAMIELNVTALTRLCRLTLPGLIARRRGGILNVASTAAFQAGPNMAVYYATKAFVLSLSEALHEEARAFGVIVTALCPGPTESEFAATAALDQSRFAGLGIMRAAEVARIGVDGYEAGQAVVVTGLTNRLGSLAAHLLPRALTRKVAGRLQA